MPTQGIKYSFKTKKFQIPKLGRPRTHSLDHSASPNCRSRVEDCAWLCVISKIQILPKGLEEVISSGVTDAKSILRIPWKEQDGFSIAIYFPL